MALLALPPTITATVGVRARVEFYALLGVDPAPYTFSVDGPGTSDASHWEWTPTEADVGRHDLTVRASIGAVPAGEAGARVHVVPNPTSPAPRILLVGDSLTALSLYPNSLASLLGSRPAVRWEMVGGVLGTAPGVRFEAFSGWTWILFVNQGPFAPTGTLDVPSYVATSLGGVPPTRIVFGLGTNDISPAVSPMPPYGPSNVEQIITTMLQHADLLIAAWRAAAPDAAIGVELIPPPNPDPLVWPPTFPLATYREVRQRAVERMVDHWADSLDVELVATSAVFSPAQFIDNVHPTAAGAAEQASMVYAWLEAQGEETDEMTTRGYPTPGGVLECDDGTLVLDGAGKVRMRVAHPSVVIQEQYGENQVRPTVRSEVFPGGTFATILTVPITTTVGTSLDVDAALGAELFAGPGGGGSVVFGGIRILVDGATTGLGSFQTKTLAGPPAVPMSVNFSLVARVAVLPGPHTVELQWAVGGGVFGADDPPSISFTTVDHDGCAMFVREVR